MAFFAKKLTKLSPFQYLPAKGNISEPVIAWSVSLNLAVWLSTPVVHKQTVSLYIEYCDSRGQQSLLVDSLQLINDQELLFSNLIKIPIKGPIVDVSLVLMYQVTESEFQLEELFVRVIEPPADNPRVSRQA